MKKLNRVHSHEDFTEIIHKHNCYKGAFSSIYWVSKPEHRVRVGISVGKKNGGAVERVRIKRQVRAISDELLKTDYPFDLIIIVKPGYKPENRLAIREDLIQALTKIGDQHIETE